MSVLWLDLRFAGRGLMKAPGFSLAAIAALALGIGPNTAIFSVVYATLLGPLPFPEPDQLVNVSSKPLGGGRDSVSSGDYLAWKESATSFEYLEGTTRNEMDLHRIDRRRGTVSLILLAWLASTNADAQNVKIVAKPDIVYIERSESGQHLNFDLLVENETSNRLILSSVTVSVLDDRDRLIRREFVSEYSRASLELLPRRVVEAAKSILVFNPFHFFADTVRLKRLHYVFALRTEDGRTRYRAAIVVNPVVYDTKTQLILPVKGRVLVWDGHDYQSHHRRFDYTRTPFLQRGHKTNPLRYGYDFVVVNEQGLMHPAARSAGDEWYPGKSDTNEAYYGFGVPIYAAGNGRVAAIHDGEPDNRSFNEAALATKETARFGNYVIIDHMNGEYSLFAHLRQGSVKVKIGQRVKQGEIIGQMGASGDSLFPHLHYELRTGVGPKEVEGLPSYFTGFRRLLRDGPIVAGQVDTGDIVESLER